MNRWALMTTIAVFAAGQAEARSLEIAPGDGAQERLQTALLDAKPGDEVVLAAGRYVMDDGLSLDVDGVTVRGAGQDKTVLSFAGQKGAGEGLLITSDRVTVRDLAVEDTKGDGIKALGTDQISFLNLRVEWTRGPDEKNGAYGVYPVSSTNVLIDRVTVRGASDAGIYVGQSRNIVLKNSTAEFNVAGIEIENSMNADVFDNVATHNAGGVLVFDLPGLPQMGGHSTRVFRNRIVQNDTPNFAPKGNIVASVPTGTGVMVMANRDVHVFDNDIDANQSAAVLLVAYQKTFTDPNYNPLPRAIAVTGNRIGRNGWAPQFPGGAELAAAVGGVLPPIVWDGVVTDPRTGTISPETGRMSLADGPVLNLRLPAAGAMDKANPDLAPKIGDAVLPQPAEVKLPAAQAALGS